MSKVCAVAGNVTDLTAQGEGVVPLYDYLAALPDDIDISVEAQIPPNNVYTGTLVQSSTS